MIVCHSHRFYITSPTKTGTVSLESLLVTRGRVAERVLPKHSMEAPEGCDDYERLMVVRNPYARLVSMFYFLQKQSASWGAPYYDKHDFRSFVFYQQSNFESDSPSVEWGWNQTGLSKLGRHRPVLIGHTEQLDDFVSQIVARYRLSLPPLSHINRTHRGERWREEFTPELLRRVHFWAKQDCFRFGYPVLKNGGRP